MQKLLVMRNTSALYGRNYAFADPLSFFPLLKPPCSAPCHNMTLEQRTNIKFLVKLGKTATETLSMLNDLYGDETMSRARVFEWHKRFASGRDDVDDDPKPVRPTTSRNEENIQKVNTLVHNDHRLAVRMLAEELGMERESVRTILIVDLGMKKICAEVMPKLLSEDQRARRVDPAPRQCSCTQRPQYPTVSGRKTDHSPGTSPVRARSSTM